MAQTKCKTKSWKKSPRAKRRRYGTTVAKKNRRAKAKEKRQAQAEVKKSWLSWMRARLSPRPVRPEEPPPPILETQSHGL